MKHFLRRGFQPLIITVLASGLLFGHAQAAGLGSELHRVENNRAMLQKMNSYMRPKVEGVLLDMEKHNWKPLIDTGVWRTPADQLAKYRRGVSKLKWGFHNATSPQGKPDSLAADITDVRYGWSGHAPISYWLMLTSAAEGHNLETGSRWGLSKVNRAAITNALKKRAFDAKVKLGWDPAHCEVVGLSVKAAQRGDRLVMLKGKPTLVKHK